jgi:MYXO-CTERM domain-containing protein
VGRRLLLGLLWLGASACSFTDLNDLKSNASDDAGIGGTAGDAGTNDLPNGALCAEDGGCSSGHCVSGVCCDTACAGACMACTASAKESGEADGTCGPAKAATDPRGDCPEDEKATCQRDGKCDGKGACSLYSAGTKCSGPTCTGGVKTLPKLCNGQGECGVLGIVQCEPAECAGDLCLTDCIDDSGCADTEYCDPVTNNCNDKLVQGAACLTPNQCTTSFCVDGVCCESACSAPCMACSANLGQGQDGQCSAVLAGADPEGDCSATPPATCGTDGECDGAGACRLHGATAICEPMSCSSGVQTNAKTCNGAGSCASNGTTSCTPYVCGGNTCLTSCSTASQCVAGSTCSAGVCSGQKSNGTACGSAVECASGNCVDGVCCDVACGGACQACSTAAKGAGADGVCGPVQSGLDPHDSCQQTPQSTCGNDGTCDGNGGCRRWPAGTVCVPGSCGPDPTGQTIVQYQQYPDTCDGSGACVDKASVACGIFTCNGDTCNTSCQDSTQCIIGYCVTSTGTCSICSVSAVGGRSSPRDAALLVAIVALGLLRRRRTT